MNGKEISDKLRELNSCSDVICTDKELKEYMQYGIVVQSGDKYLTRTGKQLNINLIKVKCLNFNIDLSNLISNGIDISKQEGIKRIYYMTNDTYNTYVSKHLIINKNNIDYYRLFDGELWRVVVI